MRAINEVQLLYIKLATGEFIVGNVTFQNDVYIEMQDSLEVVKSNSEEDKYTYYMKDFMNFAENNTVTIMKTGIVIAEPNAEMCNFYVDALSKIVGQELKDALQEEEPQEGNPEGLTLH